MTRIFKEECNESRVHKTGHVHQYNVRINIDDPPFVIIEHNRNNLKINMWCALTHEKVVGPFFCETYCGITVISVF